jgi:hypothetical protein
MLPLDRGAHPREQTVSQAEIVRRESVQVRHFSPTWRGLQQMYQIFPLYPPKARH